ncbi:MAG: hypothetical protein HYX63_14345 [Gammaproteobacteria bacterium]|nr:hypothetical protein [Gammaproteobacteria bacterium]
MPRGCWAIVVSEHTNITITLIEHDTRGVPLAIRGFIQAFAIIASPILGLDPDRRHFVPGHRTQNLRGRIVKLKNTEFNAQGIEMNQRYESSAILPEPNAAPEKWKRDRDLKDFLPLLENIIFQQNRSTHVSRCNGAQINR